MDWIIGSLIAIVVVLMILIAVGVRSYREFQHLPLDERRGSPLVDTDVQESDAIPPPPPYAIRRNTIQERANEFEWQRQQNPERRNRFGVTTVFTKPLRPYTPDPTDPTNLS